VATPDGGGDGYAVVVRDLRKAYHGVAAVAGIDLRIEHGDIFALLGPNGAGKTTTVEILEGYRRRDAGEVLVLGFDPERERQPLRSRLDLPERSIPLPSLLLTTAQRL